MFGRRPDAVSVPKDIDPMILFTPYIMTTRNDAQNYVTYPVEYAPMADYIRSRRDSETPISFMALVLAAYVRVVKKYPEMLRFVVGKRMYMHKDITIAYCILRQTENGALDEATVKLTFDPNDLLDDVAKKLNREIEIARKPENDNGTVDFARKMLKIPFIPSFLVGVLKWMDKYGLLPKSIINISPFHCSLVVTNMMSLNMPAVKHHLYNFGTCSVFLALGRPEKVVSANNAGVASRKIMVPFDVTTDDRICGGAVYALAMRELQKFLMDPKLLETPDEA